MKYQKVRKLMNVWNTVGVDYLRVNYAISGPFVFLPNYAWTLGHFSLGSPQDAGFGKREDTKVHIQVTVPAQIKMLKGNITIKTYICGDMAL